MKFHARCHSLAHFGCLAGLSLLMGITQSLLAAEPCPPCQVECRSQCPVPFVSSIPYISRLFKNTGIARHCGVALDGVAGERLGVDFEFVVSACETACCEKTGPVRGRETHARPCRETHAQPCGETHAQPCGETRAQVCRELHTQACREIQAQASRETHVHACREVDPQLCLETHVQPCQEIYAQSCRQSCELAWQDAECVDACEDCPNAGVAICPFRQPSFWVMSTPATGANTAVHPQPNVRWNAKADCASGTTDSVLELAVENAELRARLEVVEAFAEQQGAMFEMMQQATSAIVDARAETLEKRHELLEALAELRVENARLQAKLEYTELREKMIYDVGNAHIAKALLEGKLAAIADRDKSAATLTSHQEKDPDVAPRRKSRRPDSKRRVARQSNESAEVDSDHR